MPTEIRSRVQPDRLLHIVSRRLEIMQERTDICPPEEGLQVACFALHGGSKFRAHEHIPRPREIPITQETWIVIAGAVYVTYYDIDGSLIDQVLLRAGDCSITLAGGHNYESCDDDTEIYEVKLGPFVGAEADKRLIT